MATKTKEELLTDLKAKADKLGVEYSSNIGFDKLKERVDEKLKEMEESQPKRPKTADDIVKEMRKPILAKVTDLDPLYSGEPTIIITVGNTYGKVGAIIKKDTEQLIPKAIIKALKTKTMIKWVEQIHPVTKRPTGNKVAETTKRFSIEIINENPKVKR
jgi:hypothetical protein